MTEIVRFFDVVLPLGSDLQVIEHTAYDGTVLDPVHDFSVVVGGAPKPTIRKVPFPKVTCLRCGARDYYLEVMRPPLFFDNEKLWLLLDGGCNRCGDRFHGLAGEGEPYHAHNCTWFYVGDLS